MNNHFGLVFAGGGGKGAWQLGVWKALAEAGIRGTAVSGTSVGALNAVLYAQGDYEKAESAWLSISNDKLLVPNIEALLMRFPLLEKVITKITTGAIKTHGVFSEKGLRALIECNVDFDTLSIPVFATVHNKSKHKVEYLQLHPNQNGWSSEEMCKIMLASAAIPGIFSNIEIRGQIYNDGGFDFFNDLSGGNIKDEEYNNAPIEPLANHSLDIDTIILLALGRDEFTKRPDYGRLRVIPLLPSVSLGGITDGCLDFDPEHAKKRIEQGYQDAQKWLEVMAGFMDNETKLNDIWNSILSGEPDYLSSLKQINVGFSKEASLARNIYDFNRAILADDGTAELKIDSAPMALEGILRKQASALLDAQKREEIDHLVEILVNENRTNSQRLNDYALDAVAALAPVEGYAADYLQQGGFARFWSALTGKNHKILGRSMLNLAQAQYASLALMQKLQKENLLQFELTSAIHARLTRLSWDIAKLSADVYDNTREIYRSMALIYSKQRRQILNHELKLEQLTKRLDLTEWVLYSKYNDTAPSVKLLRGAMDFYRLTDGEITPNTLCCFNRWLKENDLLEKSISIRQLFKECLEDRAQMVGMTVGLVKENTTQADEYDWTPILTGEMEIVPQNSDMPMPAELLANELFYYLHRKGWKSRKNGESAMKHAYLERIEKLRQLISSSAELANENLEQLLANLATDIQNDYFRVYLIGGFSCGKSSLLNAWLGEKVLPTALTPETAVSTELFYSPDKEYIRLLPTDPAAPFETLNGIDENTWRIVENRASRKELLGVQVFLNNAVLRAYSDFCLVDMPGLSSGIEAHEYALNQYIVNGGAGIFCVAMADGTIQSDELKFLDRVKDFRCGFYLLLTKADEVRRSEHSGILNQIVHTICDKMGFPETEFKSGIVSVRTGIEDFVRLLDGLNEQRDNFFAYRFEPRLKEICTLALRPLNMLLSRDLPTAELDSAIVDIEQKQRDLPKQVGRLKQRIERETSQAATRIVEKAKTSLRSMKSGLLQQVLAGQDCSAEVSSHLKTVLLYEMDNAVHDIFEPIIRESSNYCGSVLSVSSSGVDVNDCEINIDLDHYTGTGAVIGGLVGGLVLGPVGAIIGAAAGAAIGKQKVDRSKADADLTIALEQAAEETHGPVSDALAKIVNKFIQDLTTAMNGRLELLTSQLQEVKQKKSEQIDQYEQARSQWQDLANMIREIGGIN